MYLNIEKLRLEIGDEFSISLFAIIILLFVVPVLVKSYAAARNTFKDGARKLNDIYDKFQAKTEYMTPTTEELLKADGIEIFNEFRNECIALGCVSLSNDIEVYEQTKAIHSVWINKEYGVFVELFVSYHDNDVFGKTIWRLNKDCEIQLLSDGKPMVPSLPGRLSRRTCDKDTSIRKMLTQFLQDYGGVCNESQDLTIDGLQSIRDRYQEIKEYQYYQNSGIMSRETLESLSPVKSRIFVAKIMKELKNDRIRRSVPN